MRRPPVGAAHRLAFNQKYMKKCRLMWHFFWAINMPLGFVSFFICYLNWHIEHKHITANARVFPALVSEKKHAFS